MHKIRTHLGGRGGGQRFVTKPFKSIGICTDLRYEEGGGGQNLGKLRTYFVHAPSAILLVSATESILGMYRRSFFLKTTFIEFLRYNRFVYTNSIVLFPRVQFSV